jgi:predicted TIM-barrel fold metal-dependent hydrolase
MTNYRVISADSHLEIPPERWLHRVPAQYRDRAPRCVRLPSGGDALLVEGRPANVLGLNFGGKPAEQITIGGTYESTAGTGSPEQRVREQDQDGIDAEIIFTGVSGPDLWRGIKNNNAYRSVLRAYNDYLAEEYCPVAPDRLLGLGVIPETGVDDAIAEMEHCVRQGLVGITLNAFPSARSYPSPEDDRFWAAAVDLGVPVTVHVQFGFPSNTYGGSSAPAFLYPRQPEDGGNDIILRLAKYGFRGALNAVQLIWAGVFDRFPTLQVYFAETQIGWIPNFLEQMDNHYKRHRHWAERLLGLQQLAHLPSDYVREHCYWGFLYNPVGVRTVRREMGVDRVMWATDFPHAETDFPHSRESIAETFAGVPPEERARMLAGNAIDYFHLDRRTPEAAAAGGAAGVTLTR